MRQPPDDPARDLGQASEPRRVPAAEKERRVQGPDRLSTAS